MILQISTVLVIVLEIVRSSELDFTPCFGFSTFVDPPSSILSEICKISSASGPVTNVCEL